MEINIIYIEPGKSLCISCMSRDLKRFLEMCGFNHLLLIFSDYRSSGRDVKEGARAGGSSEEAGSDSTAAIQIPA